MLAAISHDLRTPATRLRLRAEQIDDETLRGKLLGDVEEMSAMINDLLDFLKSDPVNEPPVPISMKALVEEICEGYVDVGLPVVLEPGNPLQVKGVGTIFSSGQGRMQFIGPETARVMGRPGALRRAVSNLIENALKYGGEAKVRISADAQEVTVEITDRGPGILDEEIQQVFKPFYRIEKSRNRDSGGSGLGLTVVKAIADAHGGRIEMLNLPGFGLCVRFVMPRSLEQS